MTDNFVILPVVQLACDTLKRVERLLGGVEAQFWMLRPNDLLGDSPVGIIKAGRTADLERAVRALAVERGWFGTGEPPETTRDPNFRPKKPARKPASRPPEPPPPVDPRPDQPARKRAARPKKPEPVPPPRKVAPLMPPL